MDYLALNIKPEFIKALDRRSKAYENLGCLEDALVGREIKFSITINLLFLRCYCCLYN